MTDRDSNSGHDGRKGVNRPLALLLAQGVSVRGAAKKVGVSESTVHRRLRNPTFRRLVSRFRGRMVSEAAGLMSNYLVAAVRKLKQLMDKAEAESIRLAAAKAVIELGTKLRDHSEVEERLRVLEEQSDARQAAKD